MMPPRDKDLHALEALSTDTADLERLEALLTRFNLFEAAGLVRQELRHSHFLAFLLHPNQSHGLGNAFLKRLLIEVRATAAGERLPLTASDIESWNDQDEAQVLREWRNIDLLIVLSTRRVIVVIENKIDTGEHSDQLARYRITVQAAYPGYQFAFLYLTPGGSAPSDNEYVPVSYKTVCDALEEVTADAQRQNRITQDVLTALLHYAQLLWRHIMGDPQITQLCQQIYARHKRVLDRIYQEVVLNSDRQSFVQSLVEEAIENHPDICLNRSRRHGKIIYTSFIPHAWEQEDGLHEGISEEHLNRMLLLQFENHKNHLMLTAYVGQGSEQTRQRLLTLAEETANRFGVRLGRSSAWSRFYSRLALREQVYLANEETVINEFQEAWQQYLEMDYPLLAAMIKPGMFPATK